MNSSTSNFKKIRNWVFGSGFEGRWTFPILFLGWIAVPFSIFLAITTLADPLLHFSGNRVSGVNYPFNEREMRINWTTDKLQDYDCIAFGSSRLTLIELENVGGHRCINMSFSMGHVEEFVEISEALKTRNFEPELVLFSVNEVSFSPIYMPSESTLPENMYGPRPLGFIGDYLRFYAFETSIATLRGEANWNRAFRIENGRMIGFVRDVAPTYKGEIRKVDNKKLYEPYLEENISRYEEVLSIFPKAESLGIILPISDWEQARLRKTGSLEKYVEIRHTLSRRFSQGIIDYSVPNEITADPSKTYDGRHYRKEVTDKISKSLETDELCSFCIQVNSVDLAVYKAEILRHADEILLQSGADRY